MNMILGLKKIKLVLILIVIIFLLIFVLSRGHIYEKTELEYGVTFSQKQAEDLGLDGRTLFTEILKDLGVKKIRLSAYWNEIEIEKDRFVWEDLDWQVKEAGRHGAEIIFAVGGRLPRWPECHFPDWVEKLSDEEREERILYYIANTVERYKKYEKIVAWQIENEPFLSHFGKCPELDMRFLDQEIDLVRSLDTRPIVVTDSGELSIWVLAARRADIFGTTMYRDTYSQALKRYIHYPITPGFFRFKKNIANIFASPKEWIVIELQGEPWGPIPFQDMSREERARTMDLEKFREIIDFSWQAGFKTFYLWGVEWWYWEKNINNDPALWEEAKSLFN
ncbi:hypothetical protein ACFLZ9_01545 [Patescibacteria group bacterium]